MQNNEPNTGENPINKSILAGAKSEINYRKDELVDNDIQEKDVIRNKLPITGDKTLTEAEWVSIKSQTLMLDHRIQKLEIENHKLKLAQSGEITEEDLIWFYNWMEEQEPRWDSESETFGIYTSHDKEEFYTEKQLIQQFREYKSKQNPPAGGR